MKKTEREKLFNKFNGRCAYCGCELRGKWCADHVDPIYRKQKRIGGYKNKKTGEFVNKNTRFTENFEEEYEFQEYKTIPDGCHYPEKDTIENLFPACFSCNHYKSTMDLEMFREQIGLLTNRLNKTFSQYKIAKRFGLIEEIHKPVLFYFETFKNEL